jgi:uncharacterized protein YkwD
MGSHGYFSHSSANGEVFWRRVQRYYGAGHYHYWSVGENLLWQSPDIDAAGALNLWMHSPEHRANLLNRQWREIGLAAVHVPRPRRHDRHGRLRRPPLGLAAGAATLPARRRP